MYDPAHVAGREQCILHDLAHVSWVGSVHRDLAQHINGRSGSTSKYMFYIDRDTAVRA